MKKILSILSVSVMAITSQSLAADDDFDGVLKLAELSGWSGEMLLFKMEQEAPLKIWESKALAYPNTFIWYRWKDYDDAGAWQKPAIFNELIKLTKGK